MCCCKKSLKGENASVASPYHPLRNPGWKNFKDYS